MCDIELVALDLHIWVANRLVHSGLDIRLVDAVARGASRFENLLAPQKTYWPPTKLTGPLPQNQSCAMKKNICVNVQFEQCIIKIHD